LTIERLMFRETRYPLALESSFRASDERLERVIPIAFRALQMCAHETYMDCPYFEQLMYVGDTRLECLITYATSRDDRLPRKALRLFDYSRLENGLTQSRYPSRLRQIIPPFSLWWVAMVHDFLLWRGDLAFVRSLLGGVRAVLDAFTAQRDDTGLVRSPEGWNYVDWVQSWGGGTPPGAEPGGICGPINWQYVYTLSRAAEIEECCGEPELAARCRRLAHTTIQVLTERYWNAERGLYADDPAHTIFTEHSQCLALLSSLLPDEQRAAIARSLFATPGLTTPTVYFMHYFFETCRELGRIDQFFERMTLWFEMEQLDFKTTYENADPRTNRSDCHAWGAHPLYHYFASILGIRPASPGFATATIVPQFGPLQHVSGRLVHPRGEIVVNLRVEGGSLRGSVCLPEGVTGTLCINGATQVLAAGYQDL
jgi:alpha-L-rhamnosidase